MIVKVSACKVNEISIYGSFFILSLFLYIKSILHNICIHMLCIYTYGHKIDIDGWFLTQLRD